MLKLSENAIGMLVSRYRAVLRKMSVKNAVLFAVCCVTFGTATIAGAADITYTGDGADLQNAPIGGAALPNPPSLIPPGASGNTVTVDYTVGTAPYRVFGGLSDSEAVTGNTVYFRNGAVLNNFYGGYDAATAGGFGAANNAVTITGGTINGFATAGISLNGDAEGNAITMSGGTVLTQVRGGSANAAGNAIGNSVVITGGQVGDGLGNVGNGWVIGGFSQSGAADGNSVTLTGGTVNAIEGGESVSGAASDNVVIINGGMVAGVAVRGGFSSSGLVTGNSIDISDGSIALDVIGGQSNSGNAESNRVTFTGGTVGQNINGGFTDDGDAAGNSVVMSGGEVTGEVVGGFSSTGKAENNEVTVSGGKASSVNGGKTMGAGDVSGNRVNISGGEIRYDVSGGFAYGSNGDATGNSVLLTGGLVNGRIYGGFSDTGSANGNTVTLGRDARLANTSSVYGGWINPASSGTSAGNTLNVNGFTGSVTEVNKFQNYNFLLPATLANGDTVLTVTGITPTDLAGTQVVITGVESGTLLAPGSTVTLISSTQNTPAGYSASNIQAGLSLLYDFDFDAAGAKLTATVRSAAVNPQTKALAEGQAGNMAFVNQGADLAAVAGMADALSKAQGANGGMASFGGVTSGSSRYKTGSHADVDGVSLLAGFAARRDMQEGALLKGMFLEGGWGSYDTYNSFAGLPGVTGGGDTSYYGLGALIRRDRASGSYLEGSVRGGKSRTTFSSGNITNASYTTDAGYYGAHIGVGRLKTEGKKTLDYYAKYFWTHQNGSDVQVAGDPFKFEGVDSSRLRGGVRLSRERADGRRTGYAGLAYEYEFDGKVRGSVYGLSLEAPSLKGGTGILELGMSFKSRPESSNTLELGLQGYAGKREGVTGSVQLKRVF